MDVKDFVRFDGENGHWHMYYKKADNYYYELTKPVKGKGSERKIIEEHQIKRKEFMTKWESANKCKHPDNK